MKNLFNKFSSKGIALSLPKGFTLIELLIVIAVLGVLAAIVLVAINPGEQIARGKDASRLQTVVQLGHAMQAYFTGQGTLPNPLTPWQTALVNSGDIKIEQTLSTESTTVCKPASFSQNGICYYAPTGTDFVIWTGVESGQYKTKAGTCDVGTAPYFIYSSTQGRAGVACSFKIASPPVDITLN